MTFNSEIITWMVWILCMTNISLSLEKRQTMLFSATQTRKVEDLARISLKKEPLYVGVDDNKDTATVEGLEQVNCPLSAPMGHVLLVSNIWVSLELFDYKHVVCFIFRDMSYVLRRNVSCCSSRFWRRIVRRSWWCSSRPACLWSTTMSCLITLTCPSWPFTWVIEH